MKASMTRAKPNIAQRVSYGRGFMKRLIAGEDTMIPGFGKWHVRSKLPRRSREPRSGQEMPRRVAPGNIRRR
jgi:nucleoid DNA-binding protein